MRMDDKYNIALYDKPGFTMEDGIITGRCKEYTSLEILPTKSEAYISYKELFGTKTWAIVTKYDNHIAIIDSTGNPLNNIFNFSNQLGQSENFWSSVIAIENRVFYKLKNENQKENSTK